MANKVKTKVNNKTKQTQVYSTNEVTRNLIGLIEFLLNVDSKKLTSLNATSMSDNNGGRIIY